MLLTLKQTAAELQVSAKTVSRLIDAGSLPVVYVTQSAKGRRIDPDDLREFVRGKKLCLSGNGAINGSPILPTERAGSELEKLLKLESRPPNGKRKPVAN